MAKVVRIWSVLAVLLSVGSPALAQGEARFFVDGGPIFNKDMSWGDRHISNAGVSFGGGIRIAERAEVRVLMEVPSVTTIVDAHDVYGGSPPVVVERVIDRVRARNRTASVMVARLFPLGPRHALATSIGWSSSRRVDDPGSSTWGGPVFGLGGIVALTSHFAVVPEARAIWYPAAENGSVIVRTGLGARWTF